VIAAEPPIRQGIYRILVCRPNHRLGNTLLLTPLVTELETLYPGAEIDIVSEGDIARDVFDGRFSVKRVFCLPRRGFKHPIAFLRTILQVRRTRYDLIVDPCVRSGFARSLTRIFRARYKLGFSDRATRALTHAAPREFAGRHMAQRPVNLVRWAAGVGNGTGAYPPLAMHLGDEEYAEGLRVAAALTAHRSDAKIGMRIGIFANATGAKRYTAEWWADFMAVLCAAHPTAAIVEFIPAHGHSMLREQWPGYYSSDIRRMAAVMAGLDLFVSADCGVMHLAVAAGVPTIGLFRVTARDVYTPYGGRNTSLDTGDSPGGEIARRIVDTLRPSREPALQDHKGGATEFDRMDRKLIDLSIPHP
jgi:ADP-heptose:LPS heptosyltransferase